MALRTGVITRGRVYIYTHTGDPRSNNRYLGGGGGGTVKKSLKVIKMEVN